MRQKGDVNIKSVTEKTIRNLQKTALFDTVEEASIRKMLSDERCTISEYEKGEQIYRKSNYRHCLAYICQGSVSAVNDSYPLRKIAAGEFFGVAALFSSKENYVSDIRAEGPARIIFFEESLIEESIRTIPDFAVNYCRFLNDRVRYLNRKIGLLSSSSNISGVTGYLAAMAQTYGDSFTVQGSLSQLARTLNMGRSSLFRELASLEEKGVIKREGRNITLMDKKLLDNVR